MTEIKLDLADPRVQIRALQLAVERLGSTPLQGASQILTALRDAIEEQLPKPAIEEPTEFGSIVRAGSPQDAPGTEFDLWTSTPRRKHYWMSQSGLCEVWSELTDVEVLRVGVDGLPPLTAADLGRMSIEANARKNGSRTKRVCISDVAPCGEQDCNSCFPPTERADVAPEETEDYKAGVSDTVHKFHGRLQLMYAEAIGAERRNAIERMVKAVEELS